MPPPDAFVLRFPPGGVDQADKVKDEARYTNSHHKRRCDQRGEDAEPWFRISCWVDVAKGDEDRDAVLLRLIHEAGLGSIRIDDVRNDRFWWTTVGRLEDAGFALVKDGVPRERDAHYSVDLGDKPSIDRVREFVATFEGPAETRSFRHGDTD